VNMYVRERDFVCVRETLCVCVKDAVRLALLSDKELGELVLYV